MVGDGREIGRGMGNTATAVLMVFACVAFFPALAFVSGYFEGRNRSSHKLIEKPGMKFYAADKQVRCLHCGGESFSSRQVQLNTWFATFLNLDWLNRRATALECTACGQIQWFKQKPTTASEND